MIFITGPLYSGKRTFAQNFPAASSPMCRSPPTPPTWTGWPGAGGI